MLSRFSKKNGDPLPTFEKKPFFRLDEKDFHARLRRELPECHIFPRVELASLITPTSNDPRQQRAQLAQLQGRRVDFAIFDATLNLVLVIELTPPGAAGDEAVSTAAYLKHAGVQTIRWSLQQLPSAEQVRRALAPFSSRAASRPDSLGGAEPAGAHPAPPPGNRRSLSIAAIEGLGANGHIKTAYPHIWERICLFCDEPAHLEKYLCSLSIQDRSGKRGGFLPEVIVEITAIQAANQRFLQLLKPDTCWKTTSINR